jgi:TPR repeat protein
MYTDGQGVAQDFIEAVKWYRLAALQGNSQAQSNLGLMFAKGNGVTQDNVRAHMWWNIAAAQGDSHAVKNLDVVSKRMTAQQIAEAQAMALKCTVSNYKQCD